jgi:type I restriction enzyme R subunit
MPHVYTEDQLVEQPAIELFAQLGWQTSSALEEIFGANGTLERETSGEVVLLPRLRAALQRLNSAAPAEAISAAINQLTRDRSSMSLAAANRDVYELLKQGVQVSVPDRERGGQKIERVRVVDWENPAANDFLLVSQMTITGQLYTCRPDLIAFVNGLPLAVMEFKKPGVPARAALEENITSYKHPFNGIPALFWFNGLIIASNGSESRVGSITADWDRMFEWKRVERENEPRRVSLETMIHGTCAPTRLLDLVENFTLFSEHKTGLIKILGQNHQVLGVNNAIASMLEARSKGHGRGGVFWQTQGSGKSLAMVFFSQKVLRKIAGNWTFVVVTDRAELDDQIAKTFKATGAVSQQEGDECHAQSGEELRELLRGNHRYVFTLIQKFSITEKLSDRRDIIVLTDEAHRTQYDTLALNMRSALPNAIFLAFTGTPLIAGEERTREVFGDYVSIYDFQQSVEDGATVPLFYENRTPELKLRNPSLNEDIYALIEEAQLNEEAENKLERELGRQYHIITRDDRLDKIAKDIVTHFLGRGFQGKAMVVSIDKATALKMYKRVRRFWEEEKRRVEGQLVKLSKFTQSDPDEVQMLNERLRILNGTDMAVVVSPGQNEVEQMAKLGLDILAHRKRMNNEPLDEKFKDPDDPLRIAFVCAMWMTGFDAPSCSTIYLDKPLRNHTLMQTIARPNRVFPGKQRHDCGLCQCFCLA